MAVKDKLGTKSPLFHADEAVSEKARAKMAGKGIAEIEKEIKRMEDFLSPVFAALPEDGDLTNVSQLEGKDAAEKENKLMELQSELHGYVAALTSAKHRIAVKDEHEGDIRLAINPQDPDGVTTADVEKFIEKQVQEAMKASNISREPLSMHKEIDKMFSDQYNRPMAELYGGNAEFGINLFPSEGSQNIADDAKKMVAERYLARILPHTMDVDGSMLSERYPAEAAAARGARLAAGDFGTGQYDPFVPRDPGFVPIAHRPPQIIDYIPSVAAMSDAVKYMEETTRTINAAPTEERARLPASDFAATERSSDVQDIGHRVSPSLRVLEDAPESARLLNVNMPNGVREALDLQVMQGDGTAPRLRGIMDYPNLGNHNLPYASNAFTNLIKELYGALLISMRKTARSAGNLWVLSHEFQQTLLASKGQDNFYWGSPATGFAEVLFGRPIVNFDTQAAVSGSLVVGLGSGAANNDVVGLLCDTEWARIRPRFGLRVEMGFEGNDLSQRTRTIIAYLRAAFYLQRPAAFIKLTRNGA